MDELIDIVDENDTVVGKEYKSVTHKKVLRHRGSMVFIFKDTTRKEILLHVRSKNKETSPGLLGLPGGHSALGESYFDCAKRETHEEIFNDITFPDIPLTKLFKLHKITNGCNMFLEVYEMISSGPFSYNSNEIEHSFFANIKKTLEDIKVNPEKYSETTIILLEKYKEIINSNSL